MKTKFFIPIACLLFFTQCATSSKSDFDNFPEGYTPKEVGELVSKRFISTKHMFHNKNGKDGIDGVDGKAGQDGIGVSAVTVDKDGSITVTLTDGSTHRAGSVPVTKEEVQALKITAGAAAGTAGVRWSIT